MQMGSASMMTVSAFVIDDPTLTRAVNTAVNFAGSRNPVRAVKTRCTSMQNVPRLNGGRQIRNIFFRRLDQYRAIQANGHPSMWARFGTAADDSGAFSFAATFTT
jgi:hypothetical protein